MDNFLDRSQNNGGYGNGVYYCRVGDTLLAVCNYSSINYGQTSEINTFNGIIDGSVAFIDQDMSSSKHGTRHT